MPGLQLASLNHSQALQQLLVQQFDQQLADRPLPEPLRLLLLMLLLHQIQLFLQVYLIILQPLVDQRKTLLLEIVTLKT